MYKFITNIYNTLLPIVLMPQMFSTSSSLFHHDLRMVVVDFTSKQLRYKYH